MLRNFISQRKKTFYAVDIFKYKNILIALAIFAFVLPAALHLLAAPPGSKYTPGETLDPTCEPGDTNCTVEISGGSVTQESSGSQSVGQIPFWTATSSELSKGSTSFVWDNLTKSLGINISGSPAASLDIGNVNDGSFNLFNATGTVPSLGNSGGNFLVTLSSGNGPGANGGGVAFMTGSGASDSISPGVGGVFQVLTGDGGAATTPSAGGAIQLTTGAGGNATGPFASNGGAGGNFIFTGGLGGNGLGIVTGNGGKGGSFTLAGGDGGDAGPAAATNGAGGDVTILGGVGNTTGPGADGADGNILLATTHGKVGIGLTDPDFTLHVKGDDGSGVVAKFESDTAGTCTLNAGSGELSCTSDETLKKNIENIGESLSNILALRPVSYIWKTETEGDAKTKYGFLAQQVEEQIPSAVTTDKNSGLKSLSMQGLIPYIVKAMQEMNAKIDAMNGQTNSTVQQVVSAVLEKLTVGSAEHPTGITLFDKSTGEPYCVGVNNGQVESTAGECQ